MGKADDERADRLAAALRANLRRRKAQGRAAEAGQLKEAGGDVSDTVATATEG